jgi:hypothetical protein
MPILSNKKLSLSEKEFTKIVDGKSYETGERYWRAWRKYHRDSGLEFTPPSRAKTIITRDSKGRFTKTVRQSETRKPQTVYDTGPIRNDAEGNRYAIVTRVTSTVHGKRETSYHSVIQPGKNLDDTSKEMIKDRVRQHYGSSNIKIEIVQTIDRLYGTRVSFGG